MHEPRDPPSEVVKTFTTNTTYQEYNKVTKSLTEKTKDGRTRFEARWTVWIGFHRFKCVTPFNASRTPPKNRAETLPSPIASARCFTIAARRRQRLGFVNDPSAGSPTETLLRLLLPLNNSVSSTFRLPKAASPPPRTPIRRSH